MLSVDVEVPSFMTRLASYYTRLTIYSVASIIHASVF